MLDMTWKSILRHFLSSPTIFIDILLLLETSPLCTFSQIAFSRSPSQKAVEWLIKMSVKIKYSCCIQITCSFGTLEVQMWSCTFCFLQIRWSVSSKMRLFFLFQDKVDILIWRNGFGGLDCYQVSHLFPLSLYVNLQKADGFKEIYSLFFHSLYLKEISLQSHSWQVVLICHLSNTAFALQSSLQNNNLYFIIWSNAVELHLSSL